MYFNEKIMNLKGNAYISVHIVSLKMLQENRLEQKQLLNRLMFTENCSHNSEYRINQEELDNVVAKSVLREGAGDCIKNDFKEYPIYILKQIAFPDYYVSEVRVNNTIKSNISRCFNGNGVNESISFVFSFVDFGKASAYYDSLIKKSPQIEEEINCLFQHLINENEYEKVRNMRFSYGQKMCLLIMDSFLNYDMKKKYISDITIKSDSDEIPVLSDNIPIINQIYFDAPGICSYLGDEAENGNVNDYKSVIINKAKEFSVGTITARFGELFFVQTDFIVDSVVIEGGDYPLSVIPSKYYKSIPNEGRLFLVSCSGNIKMSMSFDRLVHRIGHFIDIFFEKDAVFTFKVWGLFSTLKDGSVNIKPFIVWELCDF